MFMDGQRSSNHLQSHISGFFPMSSVCRKLWPWKSFLCQIFRFLAFLPFQQISNIPPLLSMVHKIANISATPRVFETTSHGSASPIEPHLLAFEPSKLSKRSRANRRLYMEEDTIWFIVWFCSEVQSNRLCKLVSMDTRLLSNRKMSNVTRLAFNKSMKINLKHQLYTLFALHSVVSSF